MKLRKLLTALLVCAGCVALAGIPAGASGQNTPAKGHHAKLQIESIQVGSKVGPLVLRVRGKGETRMKLQVDGHRVADAFAFDGRHTQIAEPRADALRPGANTLRITGPDGAKVTRTVKIPARLLAVDAGADVGTTVKAKIRLGTAPAVSGKGDPSYDWSIVSGPPGAKATLHGAGQSQPMLDATTPGVYVLQLEANPEGPAPPTFDQVQVAASISAPPLGVPIITSDVEKGGAIRIGNEVLGSSNGGLAYAVLERRTGAVVASGSVSTDIDGIRRLQGLSNQYAAANRFGYMVIVSGRVGGLPESALADFSKLTLSLGATLLTPENFDSLKRGSGFTVIGIPGATEGAATVRIPGGLDRAPASGSMFGYLEQNQAVDSHGARIWEFVSPDHPAFDTRAAGSTASHNVMTVEGKDPITADLPPQVTAGLHVVVLESLTMRTIDNAILGTNGTDPKADGIRQDAAAGALERMMNTPGSPLVLVQTVGQPKASGPVWARIVNSLGKLGANRQLVNALDGSTEYSIVARLGSEAPPAESSTAFDHGPYGTPENLPPHARLVGSLSRGRTDAFEPTVSSTPTDASPHGSVNLELMKVAYQPTQSWPPFPGDPGKAKLAEEYICGKLKICGPAPRLCPTVRECFWKGYGEDWRHYEGIMRSLQWPGAQSGFDEATFVGVRDTLVEEAGDVGFVQRYLTQLKEPLEKSSFHDYVNLRGIGDQIYDSLQSPPPDNSKAWALGLISKAVAVGAFAGPPVSIAAAGLSASFGLAAFLSTETGQPLLGAEVKVKADSLSQDIFSRIEAANRTTEQIGLLIVSDPAKLASAADHIVNDPEWRIDPANRPAVERQISAGSKQWFYEALVPAGYPYLIRGNYYNAKDLNCFPYSSRRAWPNQPDVDQVQATVGWDNNGNPIRAIFFFTSGIGGGSSPNSTIGDSMFKPVKDGGLEMQKLAFFSSRVWGGKIFHAKNGAEKCDLGFLPDRK